MYMLLYRTHVYKLCVNKIVNGEFGFRHMFFIIFPVCAVILQSEQGKNSYIGVCMDIL